MYQCGVNGLYIYTYVRTYTCLKMDVRLESCFTPRYRFKVNDTISILFLV